MKKILIASLFAVLALGLFASVASAETAQPKTGTLHEYMEKALAAKLDLPLATIESEFDSGKNLAQIALNHGVTQANLPAFMLEVRTQALKAAVADGVITQTQADWMNQRGGHGMGRGMMNGGTHSCNGTGVPFGGGMQRGGRWQQTNP